MQLGTRERGAHVLLVSVQSEHLIISSENCTFLAMGC